MKTLAKIWEDYDRDFDGLINGTLAELQETEHIDSGDTTLELELAMDGLKESVKTMLNSIIAFQKANRPKGHFVSENGEIYFRASSGIRYEVETGKDLNNEKTLDIYYILLNAYEDIPTEFVGWWFGASFVKKPEYEEIIDKDITEWEEKHPEIVEGILSGENREMSIVLKEWENE